MNKVLRALSVAAGVVVFGGIAILVLAGPVTRGNDIAQASHLPAASEVGIDTVTTSNSAITLGDRDDCVSLAAGTVNVDMYVKDVQDLVAWQTDLLFDPAIVYVTNVDYNFITGASGGPVLPLGDSPGVDGADADALPEGQDGKILIAAAQLAATNPSGSGVMARFTLSAQGAGQTILSLTNVIMADSQGAIGDTTGDGVYDGPVYTGTVVVGGDCVDGGVTPTPTPTEPAPTPTPTSVPPTPTPTQPAPTPTTPAPTPTPTTPAGQATATPTTGPGTPTATAVLGATATPKASPTAVAGVTQLPRTGGEGGAGGVNWALLLGTLLGGLALAAGGLGLATWQRARQRTR